MILVDSSVWIDHLRKEDARLTTLLLTDQALCHPHVIGEVALASIKQRDAVLGALRALPQAIVADDAEVLELIERERLYGRGVGYTDAHLLAAVRLTAAARLWTRDKRLAEVAGQLRVVAN